jgi:hypothetical protein
VLLMMAAAVLTGLVVFTIVRVLEGR